MKRIIAFIKPNMLDDVVFALHDIEGFPGASISEVQGIGSGSRDHLKHADRTPFHGFPKSVRMEIVCATAQTEEIVETIREKAHTGLPDDGKIYVSSVDDAVRVRTGERGDDAV
ncbi:MAG: GlnB [Nitrospiraceae bacterium]|nr:GlnB [Nitrospiraceae bacterium]